MNTENKLVVVMYGPPGIGKKTQAELLIKTFKMQHMDCGEILRSDPLYQEEAREYTRKGQLVPDDLAINVVDNWFITKRPKGAILDGFPRTRPQVDWLVRALSENHYRSCLINFNGLSEVELRERSRLRREGQNRLDDNPDTFQERLNGYGEIGQEVFNHLRHFISGGILNVDGGEDRDIIARFIRQFIANELAEMNLSFSVDLFRRQSTDFA